MNKLIIVLVKAFPLLNYNAPTFKLMDTILIWILALVGLGLFVYFVPYKNIKIVHKKLDTIIELLNKKDNNK